MKTRFVLALLFAGMALPVHAAEPAPLPPDLAAVPADAIGFVHIRVADVWKSDLLKDFRETVLKAGAKALEGFDARFLPAPSSIDRLTLVMIPNDPDFRREPDILAILAVSKPFDTDAMLKSALPKAVENKTTNGSYFTDEKSGLALFFGGDQVIVFGETPGIKKFVDQRSRPNTDLKDALQAANSKRHITVAANMGMIPAKALAEAPAEVRPLLTAKLAVVSLDFSENTQIDIALRYADDKAVAAADLVIQNLAKTGRSEITKSREEMLKKVLDDGKIAPLEQLPETAVALVALGSFERIDEILAKPPIKREGNSLLASVKLPSGSGLIGLTALGAGFLMPAVQKVRESAARATSANNLKQIGLALHIYENDHGFFPAAAICDKNGKPLLSWRVALLPYLEQEALYEQFKLDEPWDSEHNKKLIPVLVKVFVNPYAPNKEREMTHYRLFYGKDAMFDLKDPRQIVQVTDGLSNTMMAFEAAEGVPWTKPEEFLYDPKKPLPKFGMSPDGGFHVLLADGSVHHFKTKPADSFLRAIITPAGGEEVDLDKQK